MLDRINRALETNISLKEDQDYFCLSTPEQNIEGEPDQVRVIYKSCYPILNELVENLRTTQNRNTHLETDCDTLIEHIRDNIPENINKIRFLKRLIASYNQSRSTVYTIRRDGSIYTFHSKYRD